MRKMKITDRVLEVLGACRNGVDDFRDAFPHGVTITDDQETNFPIVVKAYAHDCNVVWLIVRLYRLHVWELPRENDSGRWIDDRYSGGEFALAGLLADAVGVYQSVRRVRP